MCDGEKPRTTLVVLRSELPLAEPGFKGMGDDLSETMSELLGLSSFTVDAVAVGVGMSSAFDASATGVKEGVRKVSPSLRSFFSLIVRTIFSRSSGVIWRSRPRLLIVLESC